MRESAAAREWRQAGARTREEYRAHALATIRRRIGLVAVRAHARHRLDRVPFIGVPRAAVRARMERLRQQMRDPRAAAPLSGRAGLGIGQEFLVHQPRVPAGGDAVGG